MSARDSGTWTAFVAARTVYVARKAKGCAASARFSARWKQTRPTRFHTGSRAWSQRSTGPSCRAMAARHASPSSVHQRASSVASTYSAPGIGGTASASRARSWSGDATTMRSRSDSRSGEAQSRVTNSLPTSRRNPIGGSSVVAGSVPPSTRSPLPVPAAKAVAMRRRADGPRPSSRSPGTRCGVPLGAIRTVSAAASVSSTSTAGAREGATA